MQIRITTDDGLPVYKQIVNQVTYLVASGVLVPDEELPPIRALAEQLVINPNTVARAYRELEQAGVVYKRGTAGTFVSAGSSPLARREKLKILRRRVDALLADARHMEISVETIKALIDERDAAITGGSTPKAVADGK
jgi:GntR family transcriptional regulator